MTKEEFEKEFGTLCGAYNKKIENEEFLAKAYWYKFNDMKAVNFLNLVLMAIDSCKAFPSVNKMIEIKKLKERENYKNDISPPVYKPNDNWKRRQELIVEGKKRGREGRERAIQRDREHMEELRKLSGQSIGRHRTRDI